MKSLLLLTLFLGISVNTFAQPTSPYLTSPANASTFYVGSTINFSWTSVTDAVSYDIEFDSGTGYVFLTNVAVTGYSMTLVASSAGPHTWHVRAKTVSSTSLWSSLQNFTVIGTPGVPNPVSPANASNIIYNTATNFTWSAVTNATGYKIQFDNDSPIVVAGTSYPNTFSILGNHTWKVLASNPSGESDWSLSRNLTVILGTPTLTSPANTFTAYVGSFIDYSWAPVNGATAYDIEFDPGLGYSSLTTLPGTTLSLLLSATTVGSHSWHVRAKSGATIGNWSSSRTYTVVGIPATPTTNNPPSSANVNYNSNTIFTWNNVNNASSYQIQFDSEAPITVAGNNYSRTFSTFGSHTWRVLASNDAGNSDWSTTKTFNVVLAAPPLNSPANGSTSYIGTNLGFSWTSVPGATTYDIEIDGGLGSASQVNVPSVSYQKNLIATFVGQHTWHVRALSGATTGQWSQSFTFVVAGIPATPVTGNPTTESTVTYEVSTNFNWNPVQYATSYQIQFDEEAPLTVSNSSYARTFNTLGGHTWKIKAINAAGESSWSNVSNFTVVLGVPTQESPANANAYYVGETASFSWSSIAGATSYDIEFDAGLGTVTLSNVTGISVNFMLTATQAGTHTWHVRAKNGSTNGAWSTSRTITVIGIPVVPTTTSPASGSTIYYDTATNFTWNAVPNATSYKIQFDAEAPITVAGTSYTRTYSSLASHTWKVLAFNDAGESGWSSSRTFTVDLGIPNLSSPSNGTTAFINTNLNFTWTSVAGATSYDIEFDAGQGSVSLSNVVVTSKTWALVAASIGNHTWHVRAKNGSSAGLWSQSRNFTVAGIPAVPVLNNPPADGNVPYSAPAMFSWNPVQNATSYFIQFDSEAPIAVSGTNFPRTFSTLASHSWKVKAVNSAGESVWSAVRNFTVVLGAPNLTSPVNNSVEYVGSTLEFSWTSVAGATSYDVEFDSGLGYAYSANVSVTSLNMSLTNSNAGPHTWHVRARLETSAGPWSGSRSYTVAGKPSVPVLISPANGSAVTSEQNVQFSWNGVTNASGYKVQFDAETPIDVSGTSYTRSFTSLGNHTWKVLASNDAGDSSWSTESIFTVELGIPTLTAPANATIYFVGSTINFSWTPVTGATSYDIEFDAGLGFVSLTNVTSASLNQVLTNLNAGSHSWHVRAKSSTSIGAWSATRTYLVNGIPAIPVLINPSDKTTIPYDTPFNFTWSAVTSASGYQIQFDSESPITVAGTSYSRSFNTTGSHTWKVLATNAAGKSDWSNNNTFSMALGAPTLITPTDAASFNAGATISFSWTAVSGATSYDVEFDGGTPNAIISNVTGTSISIVTTANNAGPHNWHVLARLNTTTGPWSLLRSYTVYTVPSIPVQVNPAINETIFCSTQYTFTWNVVTGATAYKIQFDTEAPVVVSGTSYTRSFSSLGQHTWKILSSNNAGESAYSTSSQFNVDLGIPNLSSPVNAFTYFVGSAITFSWTSVACANSYDIEIDAGMPSASMKNVSGTSMSLQTDANGTGSHTWHVRANLNSTNGKWSSSQTYSVMGIPDVPVLNSPASGATIYSETPTNFTWNAVGNASGYQIQFDAETPVMVTGTNYSRIFDTAGNHTWKVLATNAAGNSGWSTARTFSFVFGTQIPQTRVLLVNPDNQWDFGVVTANNTNTKTFSLQNSGNAVLKISNLSLSGANANQFLITDPLVTNFEIVPGGAFLVAIGFRPGSEGAKSATLVITSNADNALPSKSISLNGTGTLLPTKTLAVNPDVLYDYKNVVLNTSGDKTFVAQNLGTAPLHVGGILLSGLNADQFAIITPSFTSFDLLPGGNQEITIRFKPSATGINTANLILNNNSDNASPSKQITLNGTGVIQLVVNPPVINTASISGITSISAIGGGNVTSDGGGIVIAKGICWSLSLNPTISDSKTIDGTGTGSFISYMVGLNSATAYHARAYATNSTGTSYGTDVQFTTLALATVTTASVTSITSSSAVSGGNIIADGGSPVTFRGLCWSTKVNPTTSDSKTTDGSGKGTFASNITGLISGTTYHARAYATNSIGTSYGEEVIFITQSMAVVSTFAVNSITSTTASTGGNVSADGGSTVTARGVCWSRSENPTISDQKSSDGSGTGNFTSNITGLISGTTYHMRAYATNAVGTSYGADIIFVTPSLASVVTISAIAASSTTALCKGEVTADGGTLVLRKGLCWSVATNPSISDATTVNGSGTGSFSEILTGLNPGTTYHVRAFATNAVGTSYGVEIIFTTTTIATVITSSVSATENNSTTATGKGIVTSDGGAAVTEKGFCWSKTMYPTVGDSRTTDGTGLGTFSDLISGLVPGTTYHLRAYAINAAGASYGADLSFVTSVNNGVYNINNFYQIYPNPTHGNITIKSKEELPVELSVYSTEGHLLANRNLTKQITEINLGLNKGIYLIVLKSDKSTGSYRIVIL